MGLSIVREQQATQSLVSDRRLYLTADKARVVENGDPSARWLLVAEGGTIDAVEVARLDLVLVDGKVAVREQEKAAPPAEQPVAPVVEPVVPPVVPPAAPAPVRRGRKRGR